MDNMDDIPIAISVLEILLLLVAFSSGISVAALVANSRKDFLGDCILYADVNYSTPLNFRVIPTSVGKCSYCVGLQSVIVVVAFAYVVYRTVALVTNKGSPMVRFMTVPILTLLTFLVLIQAFIVSVGLRQFCQGLRSEPSLANVDCKLFQKVQWQYYDGSEFYVTLQMAQGASWVSFFAWCLLLILSAIYTCKYRQYTKMNTSIATNRR